MTPERQKEIVDLFAGAWRKERGIPQAREMATLVSAAMELSEALDEERSRATIPVPPRHAMSGPPAVLAAALALARVEIPALPDATPAPVRREPRPVLVSLAGTVERPTLVASFEALERLVGEEEARPWREAFLGGRLVRGVWVLPHPDTGER